MNYKTGDILKALQNNEVDYIAHGVNCSDGFGAGLARQIAKQYPATRKHYHMTFDKFGWKLGDVCVTPDKILNCATQQTYGPNGMKYVSYDAIEKCMSFINAAYQGNRIGLPKIGAGLGGGNWNIIEKIIEETLTDVDVTIYTLT